MEKKEHKHTVVKTQVINNTTPNLDAWIPVRTALIKMSTQQFEAADTLCQSVSHAQSGAKWSSD